MYTIIGADGNQYGPVTAEQLRQWIAEGRANGQTPAQAEGSTEWKPLAEFAELADALQAAPVTPQAGQATAQILARDYSIALGDWIRAGWKLLTGNAGLLIGGTWLVMIIIIFVSLLSNAGEALMRAGRGDHAVLLVVGIGLMLVSWIGSVVISSPLYGGLYWLFLLRRRGQRAEIGDVFAGFRRGLLHLILAGIVTGLLAALCIVPGAILLGIGMAVKFSSAALSALATGFLVVGGLLTLAGFCAAIYLTIAWMFSLPLVIDKQIGFWEAMNLSRKVVTKHWWGMFGSFIVFVLIALSGVLACCVGLIFTLPLGLAMWMSAYEDLFGFPRVSAA